MVNNFQHTIKINGESKTLVVKTLNAFEYLDVQSVAMEGGKVKQGRMVEELAKTCIVSPPDFMDNVMDLDFDEQLRVVVNLRDMFLDKFSHKISKADNESNKEANSETSDKKQPKL